MKKQRMKKSKRKIKNRNTRVERTEQQYIYVVLSRSQTILSQSIHILKRDEYTHAALSLDKNLKCMFSFGRRWNYNPFMGCFKQESLDNGIYQSCSTIPGIVIEIPVSPTQYLDVLRQVEAFKRDGHQYGYNYLGLMGNLIGKNYQVENRFYCSEFVYYILNKCQICDFGISRSLVRPQDLARLNGKVIYSGDLKKYEARMVYQKELHTFT